MNATTTTVSPAPDAASEPRHRQWLRRVDPLTAAVCAVSLVVYLLHGFDGVLTRDLGVYSYAGQQVAEGVPPYVAILNRAGPLAHLIPGIGAFAAGLVGADEVFGMRVLFMLLTVACMAVMYLLGRDLFGSRLAGLAAAVALFCFQGITVYATYGPREKTAMLLFFVCGLLAMTHQRWVTTGVFIALGTLTWQPVFFGAIAAAVAAVLLGAGGARLPALVRLAVGGLIPTAITVAWYAAIGELQLLLDDFLLINARYTDQVAALDDLDATRVMLENAYGWSLWVAVVGVIALLALTARTLSRRAAWRDPRGAAVVGITIALVAGVLWSLRAFNGWPDAFVLLPPAAVGIGGLVTAVAARLPGRVVVAATLAWVLAATTATVVFTIGHRDDTLRDQQADVDAVMRLLPPEVTMLSVAAPQPLVLAGLRNLTEYQLFGNGLLRYLDDTWPGGREGYSRWIAEQAPTVIALGEDRSRDWLRRTLKEGYTVVGYSPGWYWWVRKDLGRETIRALRAELGQAP